MSMEKTIHIQDSFYEESDEKAIKLAHKIKLAVARATSRNDHTGAQIIIAEAFGFEGSLNELKEIQRRHNTLGHMPSGLIHDRTTIDRHMDKLIKEISPRVAAILHAAL